MKINILRIFAVIVVLFGIVYWFTRPTDKIAIAYIPSDGAAQEIEDYFKSKSNMITVSTPLVAGVAAALPQTSVISGTARGMWFFEGTFPVEVVDQEGNIVGSGNAKAEGEWMTENFVAYKAEIQTTGTVAGNSGSILLKKDNPSGEANKDDLLEVPVIFQ